MSNLNVLLVDDHSVVRMGFKMLIDSEKDMQVIAEAETGEDGIIKFQEIKPDVIVMDITMPGIGGLEAIERIIAKDKNAKILVLSAHEDSVHPKRVLSAGAIGYLTKRSAAEELINAIRTVGSGKKYIESSVAQQLAITQLSGENDPTEVLSDREFEVFISLAKGKSTNEIADTMCLSPRNCWNTSLQHQTKIKCEQLSRNSSYCNSVRIT
jgi:two-component system invasion response regulator UvrY